MDSALTSPAAEAPAVLAARCNPFGHATHRGPKHLAGGLYGPEYEGPKKWECHNRAEVRVRMMCRCGHRGQVMELCRAHVAMIQRRMSGICPACVMPPAARELHEAITAAQGRAATLYMTGAPREQIAAAGARADRLGESMTELYQRGIVHRCPLTLTEIS